MSAVAVAVVEGFYPCWSGVGWSNRALIEILAEVLPVEIDLVFLPMRVGAVRRLAAGMTPCRDGGQSRSVGLVWVQQVELVSIDGVPLEAVLHSAQEQG